MRKILFIFIPIFLMIHGSCEFPGTKYLFHVINHSDHTIAVCAGYFLPDTLLPAGKPELKIILPGKPREIYDHEAGDEKFKRLETERLTVFILSKDTVDRYDWSIIRDQYNILKRYEFNAKELTDMGGSVVYP